VRVRYRVTTLSYRHYEDDDDDEQNAATTATYLDGFVGRATEQVILMYTETPDRAAVSNKCPFAFEDLLRIKCCQHNNAHQQVTDFHIHVKRHQIGAER